MTSTIEVSSSVTPPQQYPINCEYSIELITEISQFQELKTLWNSLAFQQGFYEPFLSFDWFEIWLKHFLGDNKLLILLLYKNDELVTIAPFLRKEEKFKGIHVRKIELIGNVYSPVRYFLLSTLEETTREKYLSYISSFFSTQYQQWDIIDLSPIPDEISNFTILSNALAHDSLRNIKYFHYYNWYLDGIRYSSDIYFNNLSKKAKKNIRLCTNRAKKAGKINFEMVRNYGEVEPYMKIYSEIYPRSWKKQERFGQEFFVDWTQQAARRGWLRLGTVFLNDIPIASGFAIIYNGCAYFEKTAFDEKYTEISPGTIWFIEMIKYILDVDKVSTIDFLRGDDKYKKLWLEKKRERKGIFIFNNNARGSYLYYLIHHILPLINKSNHLKSIKNFLSKKYLISLSSDKEL